MCSSHYDRRLQVPVTNAITSAFSALAVESNALKFKTVLGCSVYFFKLMTRAWCSLTKLVGIHWQSTVRCADRELCPDTRAARLFWLLYSISDEDACKLEKVFLEATVRKKKFEQGFRRRKCPTGALKGDVHRQSFSNALIEMIWLNFNLNSSR